MNFDMKLFSFWAVDMFWSSEVDYPSPCLRIRPPSSPVVMMANYDNAFLWAERCLENNFIVGNCKLKKLDTYELSISKKKRSS